MDLAGSQRPFETQGVFWVPDRPEHRVSGTLHFTQDGALELRLIGTFGSCLLWETFPLLHGVVENAKCTLFNSAAGRLKSSRALTVSELRPKLAIIGEHLRSTEEPVFTGAKVRFDCLDDWVDFPAFSVPKADWVSEQGLSRFDISRQAELSAEVDSLGCSISLAGDQFGEFTTRQINWEHHSLLKIASRTPLNIQGFIEIVFQLGHLMSLLTWQRIRLAHLSFAHPRPGAGGDSGERDWCGLYGAFEPQGSSYPPTGWMLTGLTDVQPFFPPILSAWFRLDKRLRDTLLLLTSLIQSEGQFLEFEFLALVQIVEALHRIKEPQHYMPKETYEAVKVALISAIPPTLSEAHRSSLKNKIKYGNELSLRTRVRKLCTQLPDSLRNIIASDPGKFTAMVVDGRNYLTHRDEDLAESELSPEQLRRTCQALKLLLTVLFLQDLGMPSDAIERISHAQDWFSRHLA
jgi:uncharacterized membrane protein